MVTKLPSSGNLRSSSSSRIYGPTASTIEPFGARRYFGGASSAIALRTVFLEAPNFRVIAHTSICPAR